LDAYELFETFQFEEDDDRTKLTPIMTAFEAHCVGAINTVYERYVFYQRRQANGETFDMFLSDIRRLVKTCDFGAVEDSAIRDRIVMGIRDDATRKRLLQTRNVDLKRAIDICRASESATKQLRAMSKSEHVHALQSTQINNERSRPRSSSRNPADRKRASTSDRRCKYCDRNHVMSKTACPAFGKTCNKCNRRNHIASVCKSKDKPAVQQLDDDDSYAHPEILALKGQRSTRFYSRMTVGNRVVRFLLDCGSTVYLLPESFVRELTYVDKTLRPPESDLRMFDKTLLQTKRIINLPVTHPNTGQSENIDFYVTTTHSQPLLGIDACLQFDLLNVNTDNICAPNDPGSAFKLNNILDEFADLFEGYGKFEGTVSLKVDPSITPVRIPLRKLPIAIKDRVAAELQHLQNNGVITHVTEPTAWISALLVVMKPKSDSIRLCIDPLYLNRALLRDHYQMPTIDDILPDLMKTKVLSTFNCKSAFWHLQLDEPSSMLTVFSIPFGKYRWLRLPYGITPSSELFQRQLHEALSSLQGIACIANDILVYGRDQCEHDMNVRNLLQTCREVNLKINKSKIQLNRKSVPYMGHVLTEHGLQICNKKVDAIIKMPPPTDRQGVLRLIDMATFLARYIPGFS
jgi:hypothetical protein